MINIKQAKYFTVLLPFVFFFLTNIILISCIGYLFYLGEKDAKAQNSESFALFSPKPRVLGTISQEIEKKDSRPEVIRQFMAKYKADETLVTHADNFVTEAEKYGISPWLAVSIGMCEGNLGRATPKYNGEETYNTWGWAASERDLELRTGTYDLDSWETAIETVIKGLATSPFYAPYTNKENLTFADIESMMRFYAPPSVLKGGPWAKCVWQYYSELENFKSAT